MLYTKIQPQSFLGSGEEHFKVCLSYMFIAATLFNCAEPFEKIGNTSFDRRSHVKSGENCSNGFRKEDI